MKRGMGRGTASAGTKPAGDSHPGRSHISGPSPFDLRPIPETGCLMARRQECPMHGTRSQLVATHAGYLYEECVLD